MTLETERLILREFVPEDLPALQAYQRDPRYLEFYDRKSQSGEEARRLLDLFLSWQREVPRRKFQLALILREENRLIGNCGIRSDGERGAEIGYELNPDYWGRGFASEGIGRMVRFGIEELGVERLSARCHRDNRRSAHVLEKLGFALTPEGDTLSEGEALYTRTVS